MVLPHPAPATGRTCTPSHSEGEPIYIEREPQPDMHHTRQPASRPAREGGRGADLQVLGEHEDQVAQVPQGRRHVLVVLPIHVQRQLQPTDRPPHRPARLARRTLHALQAQKTQKTGGREGGRRQSVVIGREPSMGWGVCACLDGVDQLQLRQQPLLAGLKQEVLLDQLLHHHTTQSERAPALPQSISTGAACADRWVGGCPLLPSSVLAVARVGMGVCASFSSSSYLPGLCHLLSSPPGLLLHHARPAQQSRHHLTHTHPSRRPLQRRPRPPPSCL